MTSGDVNVAAALAQLIKTKKEEENIDDSTQVSAAQQEFMKSRLKRLERNILVRLNLDHSKAMLFQNLC
jgi:molybdopterin converting factor small subunit